MSSSRQVEANRQNARKSSGPKSARGKARSARNARRYGLAVSIWRDARLATQAEALTRDIAGVGASEELVAVSRPIAEAQVDLMRIRQAREHLLKSGVDNLDLSTSENIALIEILHRDLKGLPITKKLDLAFERIGFGMMTKHIPRISSVLLRRLEFDGSVRAPRHLSPERRYAAIGRRAGTGRRKGGQRDRERASKLLTSPSPEQISLHPRGVPSLEAFGQICTLDSGRANGATSLTRGCRQLKQATVERARK